jgi:hypothetical protein
MNSKLTIIYLFVSLKVFCQTNAEVINDHKKIVLLPVRVSILPSTMSQTGNIKKEDINLFNRIVGNDIQYWLYLETLKNRSKFSSFMVAIDSSNVILEKGNFTLSKLKQEGFSEISQQIGADAALFVELTAYKTLDPIYLIGPFLAAGGISLGNGVDLHLITTKTKLKLKAIIFDCKSNNIVWEGSASSDYVQFAVSLQIVSEKLMRLIPYRQKK